MKSDAPPSPMDGDIKVEDREVRQSYGLERSTTALRSKPGKKDRVLTSVTLSLKERLACPG